jgi:NitT/TauT family transport system ATP-binding protein
MSGALATKKDHSMPLEFFRDILDEHFGADETQRQIDTALDWGRYGDLLRYDSESDRLVLQQAESAAQTPEDAWRH